MLGYDAIDTGLAFLPLTASIAVLSLGVTARAMRRFGPINTLMAGLTGIVGGLLLLAAAGVLTMVPGALVIWFVRNHIAKGFALGRV